MSPANYYVPMALPHRIDGIKYRYVRVQALNARHAELLVLLKFRPLDVTIWPGGIV